ncbi:hypothetical protein FH972_002399 [Carpinus fangiana]|uniref:Uncharacterized protein n=1 Tax=Carpinus fangiana TaxID=176857 RepID=A0A5N6QER4_9ROSI|nr:hypothetical protein FH972_002399 [Carpinus fangiana]
MFIAIEVRRRSVAHLCFCNSPIDDQSPSIPNCLGVTPIGLSLRFPYWFDCRNDGVNLCISSS